MSGQIVCARTFARKMKRVAIIALVILVVLPSAFLLFMRYSVVASEGYPTWEAVRNMLMRDGEIVIILPDGVKVVDARCDDPQGDVSVDGQAVTTKIGYSWCTIALDVEINGQAHTLQLNPQKLNNWNRMRFEPIDSSDPFSDFTKIENGVEKPNNDLSRKQTANKTSLSTLAPPRVQTAMTIQPLTRSRSLALGRCERTSTFAKNDTRRG